MIRSFLWLCALILGILSIVIPFVGSMKKGFYRVAGFISLLLGVIGIVVPVLPTTPFLLLTAWLWLRSSGRLYEWLMSHPKLGKFITDYNEGRGIPKRVKYSSLAFLWITIAVSFCLVDILWVRILLAAVAISVSAHIILIKTKV